MAIRSHRTTRAEGGLGALLQPAVSAYASPNVDAQAQAPISVAEAVFGTRLRDTGRAWVLELAGECDIAVADVLEAALGEASKAALDRQAGLVIDVSGLTFCDVQSAGLVLSTSRAVRTMLAGADGSVKRVFDLLDPSRDMARTNAPLNSRTPSSSTAVRSIGRNGPTTVLDQRAADDQRAPVATPDPAHTSRRP